MKNHLKILLSALSLGAPLLAAAQPAPREPAPARAPAPPPTTTVELNYQSAFTDYQSYQDIKPGNWRAVNDAVGKAALGHSDHGMTTNSQQPSAASSNEHSGHKMGGTGK